MSILITDMEMPIQCASCRLFSLMPFRGKNKDVCMAMYRLLENPYQRPDWCPLAEVPDSRWIPVTERLPNGNGEYLVSGNDKVWVCDYMMLGDVGGWCNSAMNPCVEYWMPLPKPPKAEDGE